jgi:hypothetical protein
MQTNWRPLHDFLRQLPALPHGWDGERAAAPTSLAVSNASLVADALWMGACEPDRVAASVVGGVGLTVKIPGMVRNAYIECFNDGGVYLMLSDGQSEPVTRPVAKDEASLRAMAEEVRGYVHAVGNRVEADCA